MENQITPFLKQEKMSTTLWFKYYPYWPLFLIISVINIAAAWTYLRYTAPVYEANASIIIKDSKKGIEDAKMIGEMNQLAAPTIVENEMDVLKSRTLMRQVVKNLGLYAPVFIESGLKPLYSYNFPIKIQVKNPDSLVEAPKIYFTYDDKNQQIRINSHSYPINEWVNTPYGILNFSLRNPKPATESVQFLSLVRPKKVAVVLLGKLDVTSNKLTSVVNLKILDESPNRSEDIINELIHVYNLATLNDKNILAANTLAFVEERLKYIANDLGSIERQLQDYKTNKGAINIGEQGKLFLENVSLNDQKLSDVNMKLAVLNQVEKYVFSKDKTTGLVPSTLGIEDPLLSTLLTKLYESELQYEKLRETTGENNPQVTSIASQIERIRPSILENIQSQRQSLQATKQNLHSTNNSYSTILQSFPKQERNLVEITREQNNKSAIYNYLLQKREEAALSHSVVADTRLIDNAESSYQPVGPRKNLVYILALGLAVGLGIIIISVREFFNRTIMYRNEIKETTSFPIIGEIMLSKTSSPFILHKGKKTFIAEQFRKLRTSLEYIGIGTHGKKVLITSTVSGEGKSFVTVNLGLSLANTGKRVVLVEFDLSNPTLAAKLHCETQKGIADYLIGKAEPPEIIKQIGENENLFLIPAGTVPDDPSDLILNSRVEQLFSYLENKFDYILVDTAPVGLLSDGYVLSKYCDATLYIVRHHYTPKVMLERLDESNKINELKNLALVFNGVSSRGFVKSNGYGYGYGYGYTEKRKRNNGKKAILN